MRFLRAVGSAGSLPPGPGTGRLPAARQGVTGYQNPAPVIAPGRPPALIPNVNYGLSLGGRPSRFPAPAGNRPPAKT